jgi:hypothetical protein
MGFFNLLETFFFISLAITFVLIMMLVYHFKGRILIIEQKCDTMFEIMNNMVKEMKNIKYSTASSFASATTAGAGNPRQFMFEQTQDSTFNPQMMLPNNESVYFTYNNSGLGEVDNDSGSEYSDEDSTDGRSDGFAKIVVSDNEDDTYTPIKIINVDINEPDNVDIEITEVADAFANLDVNAENDTETEIESKTETGNIYEIDSADGAFNISNDITVTKVDIVVLPDDELDNLEKSDIVDYRKMDVSYLRTLVITRGLVSDTKKLKKPDLIRILEEAETEIKTEQ